jgi:hypothetical protein
MASEGPRSGGTFANDALVGNVAWSNPSNAAASDDSRATCTVGFGQTTQLLKVTNFGFAIPTDATIDGIVAEIEKLASSASGITDTTIILLKAGSFHGTNRLIGAWPTTEAYVSHGGSADLWLGTWSPSDINGSGFGIFVRGSANPSGATASVDHVRITVYYTAGGGGGAASRLTKYAQNVPHMHGNNRFIRIGR